MYIVISYDILEYSLSKRVPNPPGKSSTLYRFTLALYMCVYTYKICSTNDQCILYQCIYKCI